MLQRCFQVPRLNRLWVIRHQVTQVAFCCETGSFWQIFFFLHSWKLMIFLFCVMMMPKHAWISLSMYHMQFFVRQHFCVTEVLTNLDEDRRWYGQAVSKPAELFLIFRCCQLRKILLVYYSNENMSRLWFKYMDIILRNWENYVSSFNEKSELENSGKGRYIEGTLIGGSLLILTENGSNLYGTNLCTMIHILSIFLPLMTPLWTDMSVIRRTC